MTLADALRKRLKIYEPIRCTVWTKALRELTEQTDPLKLFLNLPGFKTDIRRIVPIRLRRRWLARQLELARRTSNGNR